MLHLWHSDCPQTFQPGEKMEWKTLTWHGSWLCLCDTAGSCTMSPHMPHLKYHGVFIGPQIAHYHPTYWRNVCAFKSWCHGEGNKDIRCLLLIWSPRPISWIFEIAYCSLYGRPFRPQVFLSCRRIGWRSLSALEWAFSHQLQNENLSWLVEWRF